MARSGVSLLLDLFGPVPHVMVCVKAGSGRYVAVNRAFAERVGRTVGDVVGTSAADLFPPELAAAYDAQDRALLASGVAVRNRLELISNRRGDADWYLTSKVLQVVDDEPLIASVSVPARLSGEGAESLRRVVDAVFADPARPWTATELAGLAGVGVEPLERLMRRVLDVSPRELVTRARVDRAAHLLLTTDRSIAVVAEQAGFYDQSQLTRTFRRHTGLTPWVFRRSGA